MGSARARCFALVAALVLVAPVGFRATSEARSVERSEGLYVGMPPAGTGPALVVRRQAGSSGASALRATAAAVVALVWLLLLVRWATFAGVPAASPLTRRRHVIALRAPPAAPSLSSS